MKRAAIYIRMSTDKKDQEGSPQRQLDTVVPYCEKKGYQVMEPHYKDDGISGSKYQERPAFMRLLQDAEDGKFEVIVADKLNRLSRQDHDEFTEFVNNRLKKTSVVFDTVFDGIINFKSRDIGDIITKTVKVHQNNEFLRGLSHEVTSGSMSKARDGRNMCAIPYAYRSAKDNPGDDNSRKHLIIVEEEAEIVRWLFQQYAYHDVPLRHLAKQLNDRGVPAPKSSKPRTHSPRWLPGTIRRILLNRKYIGTQVYGKTARGDFNRIIDGKLKPCEEKGQKAVQNPEDKWITVPDAHEAIIGQDLFTRVQAKLAENKGKHRKATGVGGHILSSTVVCGNCGRTMHAKANHGRNRIGKTYWQCPNDSGKCGYVSVREEAIIGRIHLMLQEGLFKQEVVDRHIAELTKRIEQTKIEVDPKRIEKLHQEIKSANKNLLFLDADLRAGAIEGIRERQAELVKLEAQHRNDIDAADLFHRTIQRVEEGARTYQEMIQKLRISSREIELKDEFAAQEQAAGPARHRAALLSWLKKVRIFWKRTPSRKYEILGMECETQWGDIQQWGEVADLYLRVLTKARNCQPP